MFSAAEAVLECEDVSYAYVDRFPALNSVSLSVVRGERLALLGPNGCGKSTLLKILDGLIFPASGGYRAFGHPVTEEHLEDEQFSMGFRGRIGFVFQNSDAQVFSPTVRDEVAFGPLQLGLDQEAVHARVRDVLEMLAIERLADRAPHQLSAGERKRVAIASVLATNPEVLLFDEPTAGLDPRSQAWLLELIDELHAVGKTTVCATHDLHALEWVADRCVVFSEDHRIVIDGSPAEILGDQRRLVALNLVHEHVHRHGSVVHSHPHGVGHHERPRA